MENGIGTRHDGELLASTTYLPADEALVLGYLITATANLMDAVLVTDDEALKRAIRRLLRHIHEIEAELRNE